MANSTNKPAAPGRPALHAESYCLRFLCLQFDLGAPLSRSSFSSLARCKTNAMLAPVWRVAIQTEIGQAFRAAFVTIAAFTGIGAWLAWSLPLRRV